MDFQEKQYAEAFNNGYLIAKHEPELYTQLEKGLDTTNEYAHGLISGGKEYEVEKQMTKSQHSHTKTKARDKDIDREDRYRLKGCQAIKILSF